MRKKIIAGNWKMNKTPSETVKLIEELKPLVQNDDVDVVFCVPAISLTEIGKIVAKKLKVKVIPNKFEVWYNEGKSTQVPTGFVISILGQINRKIGFNGAYITYETVRNKEKYYRYN